MKIKVAQTAGFCWGVRRAIDKVLKLSRESSEPIQTYGPLIHNPQALDMLARRGIVAVSRLEDLDSHNVVIRTHGIAPGDRKKLQAGNRRLCDGTCPRVAHIQALIKRCVRAGKKILIVGDPGHAEVVGLLGFAGNAGHVVPSAEEVEQLPPLGDVALVSQTTFSEGAYSAIAEAVCRRFPDAEVYDTICDSTRSRQAEVMELARESDAVVVIGGRNSANTIRLAELASSLGTPTYHVETDEELDPLMFDGVKTVGVTAGSSTPHWMIQRVIERLETIGKERRRSLWRLAGQFIVASNIFVSVGAALFCLLTAALLGIEPRIEYALTAGCYIFAMHLLSHFADPEAVGHNEPLRYRLYSRYRPQMIIAGALSAAAAIGIAATLGILPGLFLFFATMAGLLYSVRFVPRSWKPVIRYRRLKDIPSSKDLFVGIAWSAVTVLVPAVHAGMPLFSAMVAVPFLGVFVLVYIRSVLFDIREISGDRIVGKETLPTVLGSERSHLLLAILLASATLIFLLAPVIGFGPPASVLLIPPLLYSGLLLLLFRLQAIGSRLAAEARIDATFIFSGLIGGIWIALA